MIPDATSISKENDEQTSTNDCDAPWTSSCLHDTALLAPCKLSWHRSANKEPPTVSSVRHGTMQSVWLDMLRTLNDRLQLGPISHLHPVNFGQKFTLQIVITELGRSCQSSNHPSHGHLYLHIAACLIRGYWEVPRSEYHSLSNTGSFG